MKTTASILLAALLAGCATSRVGSHGGEFIDAYQHVLVRLLKEAPPRNPFSIALVVSHKERRVIPFDPNIQAQILREAGTDPNLFIVPTDLRIPANDEMRPGDATKQQMRGVESISTGKDVDLYSIQGLRMAAPDILEVYYTIYSGPLAARGGSYRVRVGAHTFTIIERVGGWES
jgi:hypothetical protein